VLSRRAKQLFQACAGPAMRQNGVLYRCLRRPGPGSFVRSHLGPGQRKYLPGWINIDANIFTSKRDVWADLRNPHPLGGQGDELSELFDEVLETEAEEAGPEALPKTIVAEGVKPS
jgi:hypothetical protein